MNDLPAEEPTQPDRDLPDVDLAEAFEAVVGSPNTASKRWVYRQYDHEVQVRTSVRPGDDASLTAIRETGQGLAFSAGADPNWTDAAPYEGARAVALENATNVAAKGATPLAAVDCLNGGNPEKPDVYGGFEGIVDGLADMCSTLDVPVVGGNVSLYNDSNTGPIPPTPTLALVGTKDGYDAPPAAFQGEGTLLLVGARALEGDAEPRLGGSEYLAQFGGEDRFPDLPADPAAAVEAVRMVADLPSTCATHDVSHGGLSVTLAEMVGDAGVEASVESVEALFDETPGRIVVETDDPDAVREVTDDAGVPVRELGETRAEPRLSVSVDGERLDYDAAAIRGLRGVIERELE
jgi:phosphoribosylformylglycinamidine synthase